MEKIKLLIVDDHPLILEGLKNLLAEEDAVEIIHMCTTAYEVIEAMRTAVPDVALLDINLPDVNGIELCARIRKEFPSVKCIALTTYSQRSYINKMMEASAAGYLLKNASKTEILTAIQEVHAGGMYLRVKDDGAQMEEENSPVPTLTPREKEVLALIAEGLTNPQIAKKLYVSVLTVNSHRKNLLHKFEVSNTAMLIRQAVVAGLV